MPNQTHFVFRCNVDRMRLLKKPLPLEGPMDKVWLNINKIVDSLHINNHTVCISQKIEDCFYRTKIFQREECKTVYAPAKVRAIHPEANLMTCEQLFCWMGRFKKVLNSMPKSHFHFFLHRLSKRRNKYTEYCYSHNKYPLLPSAKVPVKNSEMTGWGC